MAEFWHPTGFGEGHPYFHPHAGRRQLNPGYRAGSRRSCQRVRRPGRGPPGTGVRGPRAGLTKGQRTSCGGVLTQGARLPGTGVRGWEPGDRGLEDSGTSAREYLGPWRGDHLAWSDWEMFVAVEVPLDVSFPAAAARFANLAGGGLLTRASQGAHGDGLTGLVRSARWVLCRACPSWSRCISWTW